MRINWNVSDAVRKRNPELFGLGNAPVPAPVTAPKKRLRQASRTLNKLETEFRIWLDRETTGFITEQSVTFKLANGLRYTPDFVVFNSFGGTMDAFEVKGFMRDDAAAKIKMAASIYSFVKWTLAWKENGQWKTQVILP